MSISPAISSIPRSTTVRVVGWQVEAWNWSSEMLVAAIIVNEGADSTIIPTKAIMFEIVKNRPCHLLDGMSEWLRRSGNMPSWYVYGSQSPIDESSQNVETKERAVKTVSQTHLDFNISQNTTNASHSFFRIIRLF